MVVVAIRSNARFWKGDSEFGTVKYPMGLKIPNGHGDPKDETGVYKNLLQEISRRVGAPLPSYTTTRSGLGHQPVFTCIVELASITFTGGPAKNKKQAEKNAAMEAWILLKKLAKETVSSSSEPENNDEQEQVTIARALLNYQLKEKMAIANNPHATPFPKKFPQQPEKKPTFMQKSALTGSRILPLIRPKLATKTDATASSASSILPSENRAQPHKFPAAGALRYVPIRHHGVPYHSIAPPVTIRTVVPVFSAPSLPPTQMQQLFAVAAPQLQMASPVRVRPVVPVFAAPSLNQAVPSAVSVQMKEPPSAIIATPKASPTATVQMKEAPPVIPPVLVKEPVSASLALNELKELEK